MTEAIYLEVVDKAETALRAKRQVSVSGMLKYLGVSRSGYHAWMKRVPSNTAKRREIVKAHMQCSYSKKAYPWDNACIESFHSLIKREWLNRFKIRNYNHAYRLVFEYLEAFYNTKRIHSHCNYMTPNEYEELRHKLQQDEVMLVS